MHTHTRAVVENLTEKRDHKRQLGRQVRVMELSSQSKLLSHPQATEVCSKNISTADLPLLEFPFPEYLLQELSLQKSTENN